MSEKLNPKQALVLWRMLTGETREDREPPQGKTKPELTAAERKRLLELGLVNVEPDKLRSARGKFLVLTDAAWAWAAGSGEIELSPSKEGSKALQGLLRRLIPFLQLHELPLASVFAAAGATAPKQPPKSPATTAIPSQIEMACLALAGGARKTRVRLTALRKQMSAVPRAELDSALIGLQRQGRLVLYREDNSAALTPEDQAAELRVGGEPRHLVLLEG